eukprot:TRINITY_DN9753_c0_g1_i10.p1 TRINITY_DN9753_c0_g1~~TRINITY_DN9753_c0_g1_i10.p1  ORF type:complete len:281 (-),score=38.01 TRINITY_DN9753_c0_g1_i10:188-1030(-)
MKCSSIRNTRSKWRKFLHPPKLRSYSRSKAQPQSASTQAWRGSARSGAPVHASFKKSSKRTLVVPSSLHELDKKVLIGLDSLKTNLVEVAKVYASISEHYDSLRARNLIELFGTLGEAHNKLADTCNQLRELYNMNDDYLKKYKGELALKNELFKEWQERYLKFHNAARRMQDKGNELLKKAPLSQLEISKTCPYSREELEANKLLAFAYIVCNEAKELEASKDMYGYFTNVITEEFNQLWIDTQRDFAKHFISISKTSADIFNKVVLFLKYRWAHCWVI